jgi:hypothetical protein
MSLLIQAVVLAKAQRRKGRKGKIRRIRVIRVLLIRPLLANATF